MEIELELDGKDATEHSILDIQDWIRRERIKGLQVRRKKDRPSEEEMGVELLPILSMELGSTVVVELVRSIHVWLKMRRPELKMKLKKGDIEVEIDGRNLSGEQAVIDSVLDKFGIPGG